MRERERERIFEFNCFQYKDSVESLFLPVHSAFILTYLVDGKLISMASFVVVLYDKFLCLMFVHNFT